MFRMYYRVFIDCKANEVKFRDINKYDKIHGMALVNQITIKILELRDSFIFGK